MILLLWVGSLKEVTETTLGTFFTSWMEAWKVCLVRFRLGEVSLGYLVLVGEGEHCWLHTVVQSGEVRVVQTSVGARQVMSVTVPHTSWGSVRHSWLSTVSHTSSRVLEH